MAGFRKSFYVWHAQGDGNEVGRAAALPEEALPPGRPRSASRANTPSLDTLDPARKRGGNSLLPFIKGLSRIACHQAFKCAAAAESLVSPEDTRMGGGGRGGELILFCRGAALAYRAALI